MKKVNGKLIKMFMLLTLLVSLLSGCSYSMGMVSNEWGGKIDKTYITYNEEDHKSVNLKEGEKLILDYKATVSKGTLSLNVTGPDKDELWGIKLDKDGAATVEIPAKKAGAYVINMKGEKTGGGLHIKIDKK